MTSNCERSGAKPGDAAQRLNDLLGQAGEKELDPELGRQFERYLGLLMYWNSRLNLTAIREEGGILSRHFVESIVCARAIPAGVRTLLDFGSGAGFPGIPIALCRPEIAVTLAESQAKKAAFLREVLRTTGLKAAVYAHRAESLESTFDCVAMRAVDRMEKAVSPATKLVAARGGLVLMTTGREFEKLQAAVGQDWRWAETVRLPLSEDGLIALGTRSG